MAIEINALFKYIFLYNSVQQKLLHAVTMFKCVYYFEIYT